MLILGAALINVLAAADVHALVVFADLIEVVGTEGIKCRLSLWWHISGHPFYDEL